MKIMMIAMSWMIDEIMRYKIKLTGRNIMYSDEGKKLLYNHVDEPKRESDRVCHLCGAECGKGSDWGICVDCREQE